MKALAIVILSVLLAFGCATVRAPLAGEYRSDDPVPSGEALSLVADGSFRYSSATTQEVFFHGRWRASAKTLTLDFLMVGEAPHVVRMIIERRNDRVVFVRIRGDDSLIKSDHFSSATPAILRP